MHAAVHTHPVHTILLDHKHPDTMNHEAVHRPRAWLWECAPLDRQLVGHFVWSPSPLTLDISRSNRNPRRGLCETCASLVLERLTVEGALTVIFFSLSPPSNGLVIEGNRIQELSALRFVWPHRTLSESVAELFILVQLDRVSLSVMVDSDRHDEYYNIYCISNFKSR